jgi:hypothetical protein
VEINPGPNRNRPMSLASTMSTDHPSAPVEKKTRARRATKPESAPINPATGRKPGKLALGHRKVSFFLPPDLIRRLEIKAVAEQLDTSEVLATILQEAEGLRRWRLQDLAPKSSGQVDPSGEEDRQAA